MKNLWIALSLAALAFAGLGCESEPNTVGEAIEEAGENLGNAVDNAAEEVQEAVEEAKE